MLHSFVGLNGVPARTCPKVYIIAIFSNMLPNKSSRPLKSIVK